jgi:hypothetical protein
MGVYLTGVHLMGMYLISVHLTGVHLMGVHLTGVHLMGVYLVGVRVLYGYVYVSKSKKALEKPPDPPPYKRWSICRDLSL